MIGHQAAGMDLPIGLLADLPQRHQKPAPILLVLENGLALVAAIHDACPAVAWAEVDDTSRQEIGSAACMAWPTTGSYQPECQ